MNIFNLYRHFWDYSFENPEKIKPTHVAIFSFAVEHCNRLGWKTKFGFPTSMVMEATGIKSYSVFKKHFDDLIKFGLIEIIEFSKNQYSSNIIALKENDKATDKALDKALIKHTSKQSESTVQSIDSINKQETTKPLNNKPIKQEEIVYTFRDELFNRWFDYRKSIKKPLKEISIASIKKTWELKTDTELEAIIEQSISNGWQGLFEIKQQNLFNQPKEQFEKPFDPSEVMPAWKLELMLKQGKLNT